MLGYSDFHLKGVDNRYIIHFILLLSAPSIGYLQIEIAIRDHDRKLLPVLFLDLL